MLLSFVSVAKVFDFGSTNNLLPSDNSTRRSAPRSSSAVLFEHTKEPQSLMSSTSEIFAAVVTPIPVSIVTGVTDTDGSMTLGTSPRSALDSAAAGRNALTRRRRAAAAAEAVPGGGRYAGETELLGRPGGRSWLDRKIWLVGVVHLA